MKTIDPPRQFKKSEVLPDPGKTWFRADTLRKAPMGTVDRAAGVIHGVGVVTMGEAKGHGVHLDSEFLDDTVRLGNEKTRQGLKMRFGHPNMCSTALGTLWGRAKHFRRVGDIVYADAFGSNTAKKTPHGDLYSYVFDLAESDPDAFGTSIVFTPGNLYRRDQETGEKAYRRIRYSDFGVEVWYEWAESGDRLSRDDESNLSEEIYVEIKELHADDFVDDPAANEGLFSQSSIAAEVTRHLDANPDQVRALLDNKDLLASVFGRPEMEQFVLRYTEYAKTTNTQPNEETPMDGETEQETPEETPPAETPAEPTEPQEPATEPENGSGEESTTEPGAESPADGGEPEPGAESPAETATQTDTIDREEFARACDEFGPTIAAEAFKDGGGFEQAQAAYIQSLESENAELRKKAKATRGERGGEFSADPGEGNQKKKRFNTGL